jgi:hypothetical protein
VLVAPKVIYGLACPSISCTTRVGTPAASSKLPNSCLRGRYALGSRSLASLREIHIDPPWFDARSNGRREYETVYLTAQVVGPNPTGARCDNPRRIRMYGADWLKSGLTAGTYSTSADLSTELGPG